MTQTLEQAIARNRASQVRQLRATQAKLMARVRGYQRQAEAIRKNPGAWLDAADEIRFTLLCAEPFQRQADDIGRQIAALEGSAR